MGIIRALALVSFFMIQSMSAQSQSTSGLQIIRPLGDSITFGYSSDFSATAQNCYNAQVWCLYPNVKYGGNFGGGYRGVLTWLAIDEKNRILKPFTTVGFQSGGSSIQQWATNSQLHDGYPGARTDQLVPYSMLFMPPFPETPVTFIHLGTNDIIQGHLDDKLDQETIVNAAITNLSTIVKNVVNNTQSKVYLAKIIKFSVSKFCPGQTTSKCADFSLANPIVEAYNERIAKEFSGNKNVVIVEMDNILEANDYSPDGIHPALSGYFKMACKWAESANMFLDNKSCGDVSVADLTSLPPVATVLPYDQ